MWHDPEPEAVAPGVHRLPLPLPGDALKAINTYLLEDGDGFTLIDAGWDSADSRAVLERLVADVGAELRHVRRVVVTHLHMDHVGHASALRNDLGAEFVMGRGEEPGYSSNLSDPERGRAHREAMMVLAGGAELVDEFSAVRGPAKALGWGLPDTWLDDGETTGSERRLEAVATPGHTRGHLSFLDREHRLLLSGDHLLPHITPSIGFETFYNPTALGDFLASLAKVRPLDVELVLPAHGPVFTDVTGRVDELAAHHDARLAASLAALSPDGSTALAVAKQLGWTRRERSYTELDLFNRWLAVWETLAHLELLTAQGRAVRQERGGVWCFERAAASAA